MDKIEMSLDEIIKSSKIGSGGMRRGGRGSGGGPGRSQFNRGGFRGRQTGGVLKGRNRGGISPRNKYSRGDVNTTWKHDMFEGGKKLLRGSNITGGLGGIGIAKLLVSNLDYGVSETDIHELFADFGPLKSASVHYDRSGRSLGTADVVFERRPDAIKAMKQYNGVPLDGRPMNIQLATSEVPQTTTMRPRNSNSTNTGRSNSSRFRRGGNDFSMNGNSRSRGAGRNIGGRQNGRQTVSAEELDAELDAYVNDMK